MARPSVVAGLGHHAGPRGIEFDIAIAGEQVSIAVDQCGLEPAFPKRAGAPIASVEGADVTASDGLHHARRTTRCIRCEQQVDVVGHQYIGMQGAAVLVRGFAQFLPVAQVVGGIGEAGLPVVAPLHDVLWNAGEVESGQACHVASMRTGP